jgi:hypothetical protein
VSLFIKILFALFILNALILCSVSAFDPSYLVEDPISKELLDKMNQIHASQQDIQQDTHTSTVIIGDIPQGIDNTGHNLEF